MKHTNCTKTVGLLVIALALQTPIGAQDIVLSEIRADNSQRWVEIHNRSNASADLSNWSLYYATSTFAMPQTYWWPFPAGTTLPADGYLRVMWFQNPPAAPAPGDYYTGTSIHGFLFSLGGEILHGHAGALALIDSQLGAHMGTPSHFVDWVSWGQSGFVREQLAVANGRWDDGTAAPAIPDSRSLARNEALIGAASQHVDEWFLDATPTPHGPNTAGVVVHEYGTACTVPGHHLVGNPMLRTTSLPLLGNPDFGFVVENTTGFFGESMLLVYSQAAAPTGLPSLLPYFPGSTCAESIHTGLILTSSVRSTDFAATHVGLPLSNCTAAIAGLELHVQAMVFDWLPNAYPPFQGISNALMVVIGQ
ncbi:MAG: lamin tail domain-containing protein [Planctomycetes bacterium]|nr:lamin tail domain-containing protein [Planctomycetota bacterium]